MVLQSILKVNIDPTSPSLLTTLQTMGALSTQSSSA